ncbi:MAG: nickel/cobalt transporter [Nitriliruptoraceae bacterium]
MTPLLTRGLPFSDESGLEAALTWLVEAVTEGEVLVVLALLGAVAVGVVHALGPGHGKVLVGAYLLGERGQPRDALALGILVATMHTVTVLVLGLVMVGAVELGLERRAERVLRLLAAVAVIALGVGLLWRRRPGRTAAHTIAGHEHAHEHLADGVAPRSRAGIVAIASAGGLVPSPAAVVALLTTVAMGRPMLGVALVTAFGVGLAATLTGLGLLVLSGREAIDRAARTTRWARRAREGLPVLSALAVTLAGTVLLVVTLRG